MGDIRCTRVGASEADLILGCDPLVAANKETVLRMRAGKTRVALNSSATPTADFVQNTATWQNPTGQCVQAIKDMVGADAVGLFNADAAATKLMGDSIYTNPMMMGYAWQKGWIPLSLDSLLRAIELNAVAVDNNKAAFAWGRRSAENWTAVEKMLTPAQVIEFKKPETLANVIERRVALLTAYQDAAYAQTYRDFLAKIQAAEKPVGKTTLADAVARNLYKLMAYKDEYEVARLHTDTTFNDQLAAQFEPGFKLNYHLAPPLLSKKNAKGELQKTMYGPWMRKAFGVLAGLKGLRGGAFDVFGYTAERRMERALVGEYRASITQTLAGLNSENHALVVELARIPDQIKGFGHVKERNVAAARQKWAALEAQLSAPAALVGQVA